MTLNDPERCNSRNLCVLSPNSVAFGTYYVKVVENTPTLFAAVMWAEMWACGTFAVRLSSVLEVVLLLEEEEEEKIQFLVIYHLRRH